MIHSEEINKLRQELEEYRDLIKLSKQIDENKKNSRELHEKILSLSQESQHHHENFLQAIDKIRKLETKIDEYNKQREEIAPVLDEKREELKKLSEEHRHLKKEMKILEEETDLRSSKSSQKELKERAENLYERFKRGEKLDLEDIYLLRRFNLV